MVMWSLGAFGMGGGCRAVEGWEARVADDLLKAVVHWADIVEIMQQESH